MQSLLLNSIEIFFKLIYFLIFIRIILSWLPGLNQSSLGVFIYNITEPILGPVRHMIDKSPIGGGMMLDFSPIIALFLMNIVSMVLKSIVTMIF
ncbi:MAG TPA: YggT family protein [Lachnospiraceae bacterium]|jgi:YGGT family.|nr:YggT family protein [Lachnospiraceae bacterium]